MAKKEMLSHLSLGRLPLRTSDVLDFARRAAATVASSAASWYETTRRRPEEGGADW